MSNSTLASLKAEAPSLRQVSRVPVRLSVESVSGRRRSVCVEIDRSPVDSDRVVMEKASAAFRAKSGFSDRVVAIYVTR